MKLTWTSLTPLTKKEVDKAGESAGVYRLSYYCKKDKEYRVYYVGQTKDLCSRLSDHLPSNEEDECCKKYLDKYDCYFRTAPISKQSDRDGAEVALYDYYKPKCVDRKPKVDPIEINF